MNIFEKLDNKLRTASIGELRQIIASTGTPSYVQHSADRELERLSGLGTDTPEYRNILVYIGYLISLPWSRRTASSPDIRKMESVLESDTSFPQQISGKILKYLAVKLLNEAKKPRILVVDDERIAIESMQHALSKEGYTVEQANSGAEAVRKMEAGSFDVVITDLIMGDIDGHAIVREVKDKYPDTRVIMITGYATVDTAVEAIRMGAFHYIEKPIKLDEVRSIVREALKQKPAGKKSNLCFAGGPEAETASLGRTIADALGRKFIRISLAGIKDESVIIGQGRGAEGAIPGRIIEEICSAGVADPVIMLEGLDLTGQGSDRAVESALTAILDPGRNHNFVDRYLGVPFDLSGVVFIVTAADSENIPASLRDSLEIIRF